MYRYDIARGGLGGWIVLDTYNRYMIVGRYEKKSEAMAWVKRAEGRR
jgi:hypothetical protein